MIVESTALPGVMLVKPRIFRDARGHFLEAWHESRYGAAGLPTHFVQDNLSASHRGALRGLHFQHPGAQGKLVGVVAGHVFDVAVDVRRGSPAFGRWVSAELSDQNGYQLWIPGGFAHGYLALSDHALVSYKCTAYYAAESEHAVLWNDPAIGIAWPTHSPTLSARDASAAPLGAFPLDFLPPFEHAGG